MGDVQRIHHHQEPTGALAQELAALLKEPAKEFYELEVACRVTQTNNSKVSSVDQGSTTILQKPAYVWQVQTRLQGFGTTAVVKGQLYVVVRDKKGNVFIQDYIYDGHTPCWFGLFPGFVGDNYIVETWSSVGATGRSVQATLRCSDR